MVPFFAALQIPFFFFSLFILIFSPSVPLFYAFVRAYNISIRCIRLSLLLIDCIGCTFCTVLLLLLLFSFTSFFDSFFSSEPKLPHCYCKLTFCFQSIDVWLKSINKILHFDLVRSYYLFLEWETALFLTFAPNVWIGTFLQFGICFNLNVISIMVWYFCRSKLFTADFCLIMTQFYSFNALSNSDLNFIQSFIYLYFNFGIVIWFSYNKKILLFMIHVYNKNMFAQTKNVFSNWRKRIQTTIEKRNIRLR